MFVRPTLLTVVAATVGAGLATAVPDASAAQHTMSATATRFAMSASGNAGRESKPQTPPPSTNGKVSVHLACTNRTGVRGSASRAEVDIDEVAIQGAATTAWTSRSGARTTVTARHTIDSVDVVEPSVGTVTLTDIVSVSQAQHRRQGFRSTTTAALGSIMLHPLSGADVSYPVPAAGASVTIAGEVEVTVHRSGGHRGLPAIVQQDAVSVRILSTGARFLLAHTRAQIEGGVRDQLYGGIAYPVKGHDDNGPIAHGWRPAMEVPCVGTDGEDSGWRSPAGGSGQLIARWVSAFQTSGPNPLGQPTANTTATIGKVLVPGGIEIRDIRGEAQVLYKGGHYLRSVQSSHVHAVWFNGERVKLHGKPLTIDGVAVLRPMIVKRTRHTITVTALRVSLLDGSSEVYDLGYAKATLRPSGLGR